MRSTFLGRLQDYRLSVGASVKNMTRVLIIELNAKSAFFLAILAYSMV